MNLLVEKNFLDTICIADVAGPITLVSSAGETVYHADIIAGKETFLTILLPQNTQLSDYSIIAPEGFRFLEIRKRHDFFDFFNFKQQYNTEAIFCDPQYQECTNKIRSGITFFVTYKCTYKCPFCWQRAEATNYAAQKNVNFDPAKLAQTFNRLLPAFIYFTGGEPSLYKELFTLIGKLDSRIMCRITSNLGPSFNVKKFISLTSPDRFEMLMFSYHPSEATKGNFLKKIDKLLQAGFKNIVVESVLFSGDISALLDIKDDLIARRVSRRYDTCYLPNGEIHALTEENRVIARMLQEEGKREQFHNEVVLEQTKNTLSNKKSLILCPAGYKNFHIDPIGNVYVCMSALDRSKLFGKWALPHYQPIGNIQEPDFRYLPEPILCWEAFRCSSCDFATLQKGWHRFVADCPPIPE